MLRGRGLALWQTERSSLRWDRSVNFFKRALFSSSICRDLLMLGLRAEGILLAGARVLRVDLMWMRRSSCFSQFLRIYYRATSLLTDIRNLEIEYMGNAKEEQGRRVV